MTVSSALVGLPARAQASPSTDRTRISQLERGIAVQGATLQALVSRYDKAQSRATAATTALVADRARFAAARRNEERRATQLRSLAVYAYTSGAGADGLGPATSLPSLANADAAVVRSEFVGLASQRVHDLISQWSQAERRAHASAVALAGVQARDRAALATLVADRQGALVALSADQFALGRVRVDLATLEAAARRQRLAAQKAAALALAAQRAARRAAAAAAAASARAAARAAAQAAAQAAAAFEAAARIAAAQAAASQAAASQAAAQAAASQQPYATYFPGQGGAAAPTSPGGYANPLRSITGLYPERIDQGVDYSGYGPIYAIGDGVVLSTANSGWPGGTFISYQLTDGPGAGLVVYAAEDIFPTVQVGQQVTAGTILGQMFEGPYGIETGWADPSGDGVSLARDAGQFSGSNSTAFGSNFSELLVSLGSPGGVLQNYPPTGGLPAGWPQW